VDGCLSLVSVVYCQAEVSVIGQSLVQRNPTEWCGVSECDHEASIMRKFWFTRNCCIMRGRGGKNETKFSLKYEENLKNQILINKSSVVSRKLHRGDIKGN
jgi:hypothetical protein